MSGAGGCAGGRQHPGAFGQWGKMLGGSWSVWLSHILLALGRQGCHPGNGGSRGERDELPSFAWHPGFILHGQEPCKQLLGLGGCRGRSWGCAVLPQGADGDVGLCGGAAKHPWLHVPGEFWRLGDAARRHRSPSPISCGCRETPKHSQEGSRNTTWLRLGHPGPLGSSVRGAW